MNDLQIEVLKFQKEMECNLGNPTFTWNGNTYNFSPSPQKRALDLLVGGFTSDLLLVGVVRLYDVDEYDNLISIFSNGLPQPQNIINYNNLNYRLESVAMDAINATIEIRGVCITRGISK